ncbi:LOW QUALITY PROTEIN: calcium-dependent protein kinase 4-like [Condylostylus longicornis]|uniref:LOW QUALITY PROTEIN: calcium-dependent protein kinase 4-like n=1 Tax=Condylostylus longicornis TaxID=2530218 RepID=UPI00244DC936|nr:LOW QUALITY PROTEIN: calcium-dependent protein kinase 4-like [Condylostylus longicornis]
MKTGKPVTPAEGGTLRKEGSASSRSKQSDAMTPGMFIHQKVGAFSDRYGGIKVLGKGSYGEVVLCRDKVTGQECAVKVISKASMKKGSSTSSLLREIELLKELDHPNIMKLNEFFEDSGYYYLVGEVLIPVGGGGGGGGGELFDKIAKQKRLDIYDAARTIKQVLSGINYMHHNSIVHRDLKPENLLLENSNTDALIKIIDFGLSTHFASATKMKDKIGTAYYIAPEVLAGSYTEKCDIWSSGVILYILITGRPPFGGATESDILARVTAGKYSLGHFSIPAKSQREAQCVENLIRHMLMFVPSMRYTAQQCLDHEFIAKMSQPTELGKQLPLLESAINNMIHFQSSQKLAKAALLYMGSKLTTKEETKDLTAIFERLDRNGDGQLDRNELKSGYKELLRLKGADITTLDEESIERQVDRLLQSIDFDQNGYLNYSEFVTVCMDQKTLLTKKSLKRAFEMFDTDQSGKISSKSSILYVS